MNARLKPWAEWLREAGVGPVTGWRWRKRGWITPVNISGRLYVAAEEMERFEKRAAAGEFATASTLHTHHNKKAEPLQ